MGQDVVIKLRSLEAHPEPFENEVQMYRSALEFVHASLTQTMSALDDTFEIALMYSEDAIWSTLWKQTRQERDSPGPVSRNICVMLVELSVDDHADVAGAFGA